MNAEYRQPLSDSSPNLFFVGSIALWFVCSLFWLYAVKTYVVPLPEYDEWTTLLPSEKIPTLSECLWGRMQNEQRSMASAINYAVIHKLGLGYWRLPYESVLCCSLISLYLIFYLRRVTGKITPIAVLLPLVFFHPSLMEILLRPEMFPFALLLAAASLLMACLVEPLERTSFKKEILMGFLLIFLSTNLASGVAYAALLGALFFFRGLYAWKKTGKTPWIPIFANFIAATLCVIYVLCIKSPVEHQLGIQQSTLLDKILCSFTGVACSFGELGLILDWPLGVAMVVFLCGAIWYLLRNPNLSRYESIAYSVILLVCLVNPILIGYTRGGWNNAGMRHFAIFAQLPVALIFVGNRCWDSLPRTPWKNIGVASLGALLLLSLTVSHAYYDGSEKLNRNWRFHQELECGTPIEVVGTRWSPSLCLYPNFSYSLQKMRDSGVYPCKDMKMFAELYPTDFTKVSPEQITVLENGSVTKKEQPLHGEKDNRIQLHVKLPIRQYVRAIEIVCTFQMPQNGKTNRFKSYVSCFSRDVQGNVQAEKWTLYSNAEETSHHWIWVDTELEEFYFTPGEDVFDMTLQEIRLYTK